MNDGESGVLIRRFLNERSAAGELGERRGGRTSSVYAHTGL